MMCPACGATNERAVETVAWCRVCGHRWLNEARARSTSANTEEAVGGPFPRDRRFEAFATAFVRDVLLHRHPPPARLLDAGCGAGHFLTIAGRFGYDAEGVDVSPAAAALCQQRGMKVRAGDLSDLDWSKQFDVITLWDVVEHLDQPCAVLRSLGHSLGPSGVLVAKVPTYGALSPWISNQLPRLSGSLLGAPGHRHYFTAKSLERLLARSELRAELSLVPHLRSKRCGGSARTRAARVLRRTIKAVSGDRNILLIAQRA